MHAAGTLWLVATPIGNLDDLPPRAVAVLKQVNVIACEDTRHSAILLAHFGIATPTLALHEHNEHDMGERLLARLRAGDSVAVISDAGTPLISDPGFRLVRMAADAGLVVSTVPGPTALILALCVSGFATDRFVFEGFLPNKSSARKERLQTLVSETRTQIFYESKHRLLESLDDFIAVFGADRRVAVARELTKRHETIVRGDLSSVRDKIANDHEQQLGEFALVVEGAPADSLADHARAKQIYGLLLDELPPARAAKMAAKLTGVPKKLLYGGAPE